MHKGQFRVIYREKLDDVAYLLYAFRKNTKNAKNQDIDAANRT